MTTYTEIFGGGTIYPAEPTFISLSFSASVTLQWPIEQAVAGDNIVAKIIELHPSTTGLSVMLADAREVSTGYTVVFYNAESSTVTVKNTGGGTLLTVASGEAWQIYLRDNSTANGLWRTFQQGAGTSTANAASLAGAGLKAITTTLNTTLAPTAHTTDYVIVNADRATIQEWTGASGTFTLPSPATVGSDWYVGIKNAGTGSVTIAPTAGTIDGSASLILAVAESAWFYTDGANFFSMGLGQAVNSVFDFIVINVSGTGDYTLTGAELNRISYEFVGVLTGNRNIIVPASVQQYWVDNETSGAFTLTVKTALGSGYTIPAGQRTILYCNGTDVINAETILVTTPVVVNQGGTGAVTLTGVLVGNGTSPITGTAIAQGDLPYGSALDTLTVLAKDTNATRYLGNTGSSNNPAWAQVNVANGVTGTLGIGNGGTNAVTANSALNNLLPSQGTHSGQYLGTDGTNTSWSAVSGTALTAGSFTGTLTGMTGATTGTVNWVKVSSALGAIVTLTWGTIAGTSNTTGLSMTGLDAAVQPASDVVFPVMNMIDSANTAISGSGFIASGGSTLTFGVERTDLTVNFVRTSNTGWTNSSTKGLGGACVTYGWKI